MSPWSGNCSLEAMKRIHGYTLLELAIVLIVLALLVGGLLKWETTDSPQPPAPVAQPK